MTQTTSIGRIHMKVTCRDKQNERKLSAILPVLTTSVLPTWNKSPYRGRGRKRVREHESVTAILCHNESKE